MVLASILVPAPAKNPFFASTLLLEGLPGRAFPNALCKLTHRSVLDNFRAKVVSAQPLVG